MTVDGCDPDLVFRTTDKSNDIDGCFRIQRGKKWFGDIRYRPENATLPAKATCIDKLWMSRNRASLRASWSFFSKLQILTSGSKG